MKLNKYEELLSNDLNISTNSYIQSWETFVLLFTILFLYIL